MNIEEAEAIADEIREKLYYMERHLMQRWNPARIRGLRPTLFLGDLQIAALGLLEQLSYSVRNARGSKANTCLGCPFIWVKEDSHITIHYEL